MSNVRALACPALLSNDSPSSKTCYLRYDPGSKTSGLRTMVRTVLAMQSKTFWLTPMPAAFLSAWSHSTKAVLAVSQHSSAKRFQLTHTSLRGRVPPTFSLCCAGKVSGEHYCLHLSQRHGLWGTLPSTAPLARPPHFSCGVVGTCCSQCTMTGNNLVSMRKRSNPSIERTNKGWLRHPLFAAHVKR